MTRDGSANVSLLVLFAIVVAFLVTICVLFTGVTRGLYHKEESYEKPIQIITSGRPERESASRSYGSNTAGSNPAVSTSQE